MPIDFPDKLYIPADTVNFYLVNNWEPLLLLSIFTIAITGGIFLTAVCARFKYHGVVATGSALVIVTIISILIVMPPKELLIGRLINKIMLINNIPTRHYSIVRGILEEQGIFHTNEEVVRCVAKFRLNHMIAPIPLIEIEEGVIYDKIKPNATKRP